MTELIESEPLQTPIIPNTHDLPDGWERKGFEDVIEVVNGQVDPKNEPYRSMPHIGPANMEKTTGRLLNYRTAEEDDVASGKYLFTEKHILYSKIRPELCKVVYPNFCGVASADVYPITAKKGVADTNFLFYIFLSKRFHSYAVSVSARTGMPKVNREDLLQYAVNLPPLDQQRKIAAILSTWDEAIQTAQQLLMVKQERKRGLMQQLLTGQKRLPGFSEKWPEVHFSDMLREVKRPVKWNDDEVYNLLSVRRRSGGVFFRESLSGREIMTQNLRTAKAGEFLISKMQIVHGASGLVREEHDGMKISGSYIAVVSRDSDLLDIEFFDWYSQLKSFYRLCYTSSYGVHIEKMTFDFTDFLKRKISIPPTVAEQRAITAVLNATNEEIRLATAEVQALQHQKRGLMQELLTGNKLVTVDE